MGSIIIQAIFCNLKEETQVKVGLIGLGKMGMNLGKNLIDNKHRVMAFDLNTNTIEEIKKYGVKEHPVYKILFNL